MRLFFFLLIIKISLTEQNRYDYVMCSMIVSFSRLCNHRRFFFLFFLKYILMQYLHRNYKYLHTYQETITSCVCHGLLIRRKKEKRSFFPCFFLLLILFWLDTIHRTSFFIHLLFQVDLTYSIEIIDLLCYLYSILYIRQLDFHDS